MGDACDPLTDSDGDGMPDDWETRNGLDPNSDDAAVVAIEALESMDPGDVQFEGQGGGKPEHMPFGLIHFKLRVNEQGAEAAVTVYLSEPAPADSKWVKFDPIADTWLDYSEYAVLSSDRKSVTLTIVDGGFGDLDGTANGIIIDPSGLGTPEASADDISGVLENLLGNAGCFIASAAQQPSDMQRLNFSSDGRSRQWAILILLLASLIIFLKKRGLKLKLQAQGYDLEK